MADGSSRSLDFGQELVVDLFAGGGGASLGLARAYRHPDVAVNHNAIAIAVHQANHPDTQHYVRDVFEVDPLTATQGRPVGLLWASPDCRHHSKAKGGKPRSKKIRGLAWVVIKWASACMPRLIMLENVEEFADWGPLDAEGKPCPLRKGHTFRRWKRQLENLGYVVEHRELIAADYGAPTIRKRLYVIARRDGRPIMWPKPTHSRTGAGGLPKWRAAAECIDWSLPAKSIFGRKRPIVRNTCRRIAKGVWRYVLTAAEPYIVRNIHGNGPASTNAPMPTLLTGNHTYLARPVLAPFLTEHANSSTQRTFDVADPLRTQCAQVKGGHFAMAAVHLTTLRGTSEAHLQGDDLAEPLSTVTGQGTHHALVAAHITKFRANSVGSDLADPMHTVTAGGDMKRPAGAAHAMGLVAATMVQTGYGEREGQAPRALDLQRPLGTVVAGGVKHAVVQAVFMEQAAGGPNSNGSRPREMTEPVSTITASGSQQQLVQAYLVKYYGEGGQWQGCGEPMHTVPTKDRMGLVQVVQVPAPALSPELLAGARACAAFLHEHLPEHFPAPADIVLVGDYVLVDITLRMLVPRELARAQGFGDDYEIERGLFETAPGTGICVWRPVTKTDQLRLIGNSVCPDVAFALASTNAAELIDLYRRAAA